MDRSEAKQKKKAKHVRSEAVLIRPMEGKSYAQVLGEIREKVKPEDTDTVINRIRQTRDGCILLELGGVAESRENFTGSLKDALGKSGTVESRKPKATLEIRDLDGYTIAREVEEAIKRDLKEGVENLKVTISKPNTRGQIFAIVEMSEQAASKLLDAEKIPDRKDLCYKCGKSGHKGASCNNTPQCVLCVERELPLEERSHIPGTGKCRVFRDVLARAKGNSRA